MSRLRTWFLNLFIVFITAIIAAHLVWTYSPVKNDIKQKIISELRPYLGESFLLHDFTVGLGHISFHEVTTTNVKHTYNLNLQEVRIGFDMLKLLWYEFKPLKVIETVTLKDPQLIVYQSPRKRIEGRSDSLSSNRVINSVLMNFQKIPNIDRILVNGANIIWELNDGQQLPLLGELNGYLVNTSNSDVDFDLVGKFYGSSNSVISLSGKFDLFHETMNSWLIMDDCPVSSDFPFLKNGVYTFDNAILNGEVHVSSKSFLVDSLKLFGNINARDFSAHIFNQHAVAENIDMEFMGQTISFKKFRGMAEDGNFEFQGVIENLLNPQIHWYLDVDHYSAKFLNNSHSIFENVIDGKLKAHAEFHGPLKKIQVTATATSDEIQFAVVPFRNVEAKLTYSSHLLEFSHVRADFRKFRTVGSGKVDFDKDHIRFIVKSDLRVPAETFDVVDKLNESEFILNTDFSGDIRKKQFYGSFDYSFANGNNVLFEGGGPYTLDDQFLYFTLHSIDLPDTVLVAGAVDKLFKDPTFKILSVRNFPVKECTSSPVVAETADDYRVNLFFEGPYNLLQGRMSVLSKQQNDSLIV